VHMPHAWHVRFPHFTQITYDLGNTSLGQSCGGFPRSRVGCVEGVILGRERLSPLGKWGRACALPGG
jgi:hypothetical protein